MSSHCYNSGSFLAPFEVAMRHEVKVISVCPTQHYGEREFTPDELIADDEDYEWVV